MHKPIQISVHLTSAEQSAFDFKCGFFALGQCIGHANIPEASVPSFCSSITTGSRFHCSVAPIMVDYRQAKARQEEEERQQQLLAEAHIAQELKKRRELARAKEEEQQRQQLLEEDKARREYHRQQQLQEQAAALQEQQLQQKHEAELKNKQQHDQAMRRRQEEEAAAAAAAHEQAALAAEAEARSQKLEECQPEVVADRQAEQDSASLQDGPKERNWKSTDHWLPQRGAPKVTVVGEQPRGWPNGTAFPALPPPNIFRGQG